MAPSFDIASSAERVPFQRRNPNTTSVDSNGGQTMKGRRGSSLTRVYAQPSPSLNMVENSIESNTPRPTATRARSLSVPRSVANNHRLSPSTPSSSIPFEIQDGDILIEEKRRKMNSTGYTVHRYLRGRMLGKGGFAKVYMCTALDTNKEYAVKVVPKADLIKPRAKQKVRNLQQQC